MPDSASDICGADGVSAAGAAGVAAADGALDAGGWATGALEAAGAEDPGDGEEPHAAATASSAARRIAADTSKAMHTARLRPAATRWKISQAAFRRAARAARCATGEVHSREVTVMAGPGGEVVPDREGAEAMARIARPIHT